MNRTFQVRLAILLASVVLISTLLSMGAQGLWRRIAELEQQLSVAHLEAFHLASDFQQQLLKLNNLMLRFIVSRQPETRMEFDQTSRDLKEWLRIESPKLTSDRERRLLKQIEEAFDAYLGAAAAVHNTGVRSGDGGRVLPELSEVEQREQQLLELSLELGDAHRVAKESFLKGANRSLAVLRHVLLGGLALLILLLGTIGWVIYRGLIAPLRTRLIHSEELLRRQQKLATLGTLAAGIAHEIRNPLTSIKARLYTLSKHVAPGALAVKDVGVIGSEINRLERIVQEVLQFARPADPVLAVVPANEPLRDVAELLAPDAAKAGMNIHFVPGPDLTVRIDSAQMKQVLINLIRNAIEAMEPGGTVTLRVRGDHPQLGGRQRAAAILEVENTGGGIPPEVQEQLFDPFFTTKQAGSGLGLSIAARITENHDGILQYRTVEGQGTTFQIVLPAVPSDVGRPVQDPESNSA